MAIKLLENEELFDLNSAINMLNLEF